MFMDINDIEINLHHLSEVDSTNTYTKERHAELADGTLVYADVQTAGRGRLDRVWLSKKGNFFGTLLMKKLSNPFLGTMVLSLGAMDAIKRLAPELPVWLKWPNDLYLEGAKLAGILSETVQQADGSRIIAAGIGVNLVLSDDDLHNIGKPAAAIGSDKINPEKFALELAISAKMYYIMGIACSEKLFELWRKRSNLVGMELVLELGSDKSVSGTAVGIAPDGGLILKDQDGSEKTYYCGDVSVNRESVRRAWERKKSAGI